MGIISSFHEHPELEMVETNIIVLCEGDIVNCHFFLGHFRNWKHFNPDVVAEAVKWFENIVGCRNRYDIYCFIIWWSWLRQVDSGGRYI